MADWAEEVDRQEKELRKLKVSQDVTEDTSDVETSRAEASLLTKVLRTKLVDSHNAVEVQQCDPSSPLYSAKSFEELNLEPNLLRGIYNMKFNRPSKIQERALPLLLAEPPQNLIAQGQSGTGKTAAFVLAMLSKIDSSKPYPQVICLSPTYDLAKQTGSVVEKMSRYCPDISIKYALRGVRVQRDQKIVQHCIIGTAGTLLDWVVKLRVFNPKLITMFVLDEADVMIDEQGQQNQTIRIHRLLGPTCQVVLFSATYSDDVLRFTETIVGKANIVRLRRDEESLSNIKQFFVRCAGEEGKLHALANLYGVLSIGQAIVFCHSRKSAKWLATRMSLHGHAVALVTGECSIEARVDVLNRFREAKEKLLITTNLCARGIDVEQVTIVINYDVPLDGNHRPDCETYLHRIGRTGRFGKMGIAINFIDSQSSFQALMAIQDHFGKPIRCLDVEDPDAIENIQN